ncbi:MAG: PASTA domain-containing protein, partial [Calditrichaeota bacterium]
LTQIPERTEQNLWPEVEGRDVETAERILKEQHLPYRVVGEGPVVQEQHLEKDEHHNVTLVLTLSNPDPKAEYQEMPDLTGLSVRQAVAEASRRGLKVKLFGRGRVYRQKPEAGSKVRTGAQCMLECRPPVRLSLLESGSKEKDK